MQFAKLSIRTKLILTFVVVGATPLITSNLIAYHEASKALESQTYERSRLVALSKAKSISGYFSAESNALVDLASSQMVVTALEQFAKPFSSNVVLSPESAQNYRSEIAKFYDEQFGQMYLEKTKQKLPTDQIVAKLDDLSLLAQYDFIVTNENELGKKDNLVIPKRSSPYALVHQQFHSFFRSYLNRHALYDLFLVNSEGRIVYSVFKETDFATSLRNGPWTNMNIARAFENGIKLKSGEVYVEDFAPYAPSYEAPASFAITPIVKDGKSIGCLMVQLPLDKISAVANERDGMGAAGEILLLGSDMKLRADTYRNKKTHTVNEVFKKDSKVSVESAVVQKAKSGEEGFMRNVSYDGLATLAYYLPVKINNLTWYVITELSEEEASAGLHRLWLFIIGILIVGTLLIATVAILFGSGMARTLKGIVETLRQTSTEVLSASSQSASSATELSEASTEQASSLQETMASVEEISAMVNQNADSAIKTQNVVDTNKKVTEEGSRSVDDMLGAISEIKQTNDQVLTQMEKSNKEFGDIVKIIAEIGEKTNVINEIVFQTKLLSFNASVEAARAGEHGKGFAVVAEEVGNLAQMSGKAAKEITDMLSDSIKRVESIVEHTRSRVDQLIETGKDKIAVGQARAEECRDVLNKITENARSIAVMINEITHASKEQSQGIQEINKAISQLDQVTQQNTAVAQQSSSQAEHLKVEADSLALAVNQLVTFVSGSTTASYTSSKTQYPESGKIFQFTPRKREESSTHVNQANVANGVPQSNDPGFEEL